MPEVLALGLIPEIGADIGIGAAALGGADVAAIGGAEAAIGADVAVGGAAAADVGAALGAADIGGVGGDIGFGALGEVGGGGTPFTIGSAVAPEVGIADPAALGGVASDAGGTPIGLGAELGGTPAGDPLGGLGAASELGPAPPNISGPPSAPPFAEDVTPFDQFPNPDTQPFEPVSSADQRLQIMDTLGGEPVDPNSIPTDPNIPRMDTVVNFSGKPIPEAIDTLPGPGPVDELPAPADTLDPEAQFRSPTSPGDFQNATLQESLDLGPKGETNILQMDPTPSSSLDRAGRFAVSDFADFGGADAGGFFDSSTLGDVSKPGGAFTDLGAATPSMPSPESWAATVNPEQPSFLGADTTPGGGDLGGGAGGGKGGAAGGGLFNQLGLSSLGITPMQALGAGALGGFALMGPGSLPKSAEQAEFQASKLGKMGRQMLADAQAGKITPAQQAQLDEMQASGEANLRQQFYRMGRDPNTDSGFQSALQQLKAQVEAQRQQFIDQMQAFGLQQLQLSEQALAQAAQMQVQLDTNFRSALANALGGASRLFAAQSPRAS